MSNHGVLTQLPKVEGSGRNPKGLHLAVYKDPEQSADTIASQWIITDRLQIGKQDTDGKVVLAHSYEIKAGNFVDISATLDIFTPGMNHRKCVVRLWMNRINHLASRRELELLKQQHVSCIYGTKILLLTRCMLFSYKAMSF